MLLANCVAWGRPSLTISLAGITKKRIFLTISIWFKNCGRFDND